MTPPAFAALGELFVRGTQPDGRDPCALVFDQLRTEEEYAAYLDRTTSLRRRRRQIELLLAGQAMPLALPGYDALIDQQVLFQLDTLSSFETVDGVVIPNFRERLICPVTRLNGRMRGVLLAIRDALGHDLSGRVYLVERLSAFYEFVAQRNPGVVGSEFLGDAVARGAERDGVRNEDVTAISFPDASFDLIVCSEVLEHVPHYQRALAELYRVLAPGGQLVLTVPFLADRADHFTRARLDESGAIVHLHPPEYHGDPLNSEGILCYYNFGWSLLDDLRGAGFADAAALLYWSLHHGLIGENLTVFRARK